MILIHCRTIISLCLLPDDANEGLWVGTNNGLNYINLKTNQITKYQTDDYPNMPGNNIAVLQFDQSGNLWVGTPNRVMYMATSFRGIQEEIFRPCPGE